MSPRDVTDPAECTFYHTVELPRSGLQRGLWDLRPGLDRYIPALDYAGATVLDVGAANGFLTFEFERRGAEVVAFDVAADARTDWIPFHDLEPVSAPAGDTAEVGTPGEVERIKNAFWLAHRELGSSARVVYGHANEIPPELGPVDIAFLGNILMHLRDPFGAIECAAKLARRVVVTEALWRPDLDTGDPLLYWLPALRDDAPSSQTAGAWWQVNSAALERWLEALGCRLEDRWSHEQEFTAAGVSVPHYTVVASCPARRL